MVTAACSKAHPFDVILTRDQARFGRGYQDGAIRNRLREHNVAVDSIANPALVVDGPQTPTAELQENMQSAFDIYQRKHSTVQMIDGQKAKARKGGLPGAQATCYGYKQDWKSVGNAKPVRTPVIDKPKAKVVRAMFRRYIAGASLTGITRWLNDSGMAAPRGVQWYEPTVRKILANETYLGRMVYGLVKKTKHPVTRMPVNTKGNPDDVIRVDNAFPSIIDQKSFDRVQDILARNESSRPLGGHPGNTLRGIGKCVVCGWSLAHQRKSKSEQWYYMCQRVKCYGAGRTDPGCKGILSADYVDEVVALFLRRVLNAKVTDIRAQVAQYNATASSLTGLSQTEELDIAIAEHEGKVENVVNAIAKTGDSPALLKRLTAYEFALADLRQKRNTIAAAVSIKPVEVEPILEARAGIREALRDGDTAQMRTLLAAIVSTVRCDWSQRFDPVLSFNYAFDGGPRRARLTLLSADMDPLDISDVRAPGDDGNPSVSIAVAGAPLTFIPKWSITNAERATEEALEKIAQVLKG